MTNEEVLSRNAKLVDAIKAEVERVQRVRNAAPRMRAALDELISAACDIHPTGPSLVSINRLHAAIDKGCAAIAAAEPEYYR